MVAILNVFESAYRDEMGKEDFSSRLKIIKDHFIKRDYVSVRFFFDACVGYT